MHSTMSLPASNSAPRPATCRTAGSPRRAYLRCKQCQMNHYPRSACFEYLVRLVRAPEYIHLIPPHDLHLAFHNPLEVLQYEYQYDLAKDLRFVLIFRDKRMGTGTRLLCIAIIPARSGIHRGDQLKVGREGERSFCAADGDYFIFHGLAHHFQDARAEFGKFIQKQNAAMRHGNFSRLGDVSASHQPSM